MLQPQQEQFKYAVFISPYAVRDSPRQYINLSLFASILLSCLVFFLFKFMPAWMVFPATVLFLIYANCFIAVQCLMHEVPLSTQNLPRRCHEVKEVRTLRPRAVNMVGAKYPSKAVTR